MKYRVNLTPGALVPPVSPITPALGREPAAGTGTWRPGCHLLLSSPGTAPARAGCGRRDVKVRRL